MDSMSWAKNTATARRMMAPAIVPAISGFFSFGSRSISGLRGYPRTKNRSTSFLTASSFFFASASEFTAMGKT